MPENVLEKIINKKKEKIIDIKKKFELSYLRDLIDKNDTFINFKNKIVNNENSKKFSIIAEIKKG